MGHGQVEGAARMVLVPQQCVAAAEIGKLVSPTLCGRGDAFGAGGGVGGH